MKQVKRFLIIGMVMCLCLTALTGCGIKESSFWRSITNVFDKSEIVFQATTRFLYSVDGGASWSETIQEVDVDETYYLAIEMQVSQSEETKDEQISHMLSDVLKCEDSDFKKRLIIALSKLDDAGWEALEKFIDSIAIQNQEE